MFATIGHTFELMKMSWRVLMKDRELILFPLLSGVSVLALLAVFAGIGAGTGSLDRVLAASAEASAEEVTVVDAVLGITLYVLAYFVVIFFNSALVAAALDRLRGGEPDVGSGLRAAQARLPAIIGWALIAATVGLLLQALRGRTDNPLGRMAVSLVGGVWAYVTFFVIPVLVAEGIGPIEAIKRSSGLFRRTWGRQVTASFGFGFVYVIAMLIAFLPAAALFAIAPLAGIVVGVLSMALALAVVAALEGIFKAALYEFANGESPLEFDRSTLQTAYQAL
jgi:hypothetical protein